MRGYVSVVIGLSYGDEGKGKLVDHMAKDYQWIIKCNGGANAGNTQIIDGKFFATHHIPAGIQHEHCMLGMGPDMVADPISLLQEIRDIEALGINLEDRLKIHSNISLVKPTNKFIDGITGGKIGTTGKGIGPTIADQARRNTYGVQRDITFSMYLSDPKKYREEIKKYIAEVFDEAPELDRQHDMNELLEEFDDAVKSLEHFLVDSRTYFIDQQDQGKNILIMGSNGVCLDNKQGISPYTTASRTLATTAVAGAGLNFNNLKDIIGVYKAINTRVGSGPLIGEFGGIEAEQWWEKNNKFATKQKEASYQLNDMFDQSQFLMGQALRVLTGEYGATSGRPRRLAALDLFKLREFTKLNGLTGVFITKVDQLAHYSHQSTMLHIPIIEGYKIDGRAVDCVPTNENDYRKVEPIYSRKVQSFVEDISQIRDYNKLPQQVKEFIKLNQDYLGVPVLGIGVGPKAEETIMIE